MMWPEMGWTPVAGCYMSKSGAKKEPEGGGGVCELRVVGGEAEVEFCIHKMGYFWAWCMELHS